MGAAKGGRVGSAKGGRVGSTEGGQIGSAEGGQMIVEYILLLVVAITIAFSLRTALVKTGETPDESGAVQKRWGAVESAIGADDPNKKNQ